MPANNDRIILNNCTESQQRILHDRLGGGFCLHDGWCMVGTGEHIVCVCKPGFTGEACEVPEMIFVDRSSVGLGSQASIILAAVMLGLLLLIVLAVGIALLRIRQRRQRRNGGDDADKVEGEEDANQQGQGEELLNT